MIGTKLTQNVPHVTFYRLLADEEPLRDVTVAISVR
jgi:hypothetical protein